jgi:hypothetical protein
MHTQHALALARQRQADLRRGAPTPRLPGPRWERPLAALARVASRKRQRFGWLLVEVGLQLAVEGSERPEAPAGETRAAA